jgi:Ca2+-binding EF-hand superfamily protein
MDNILPKSYSAESDQAAQKMFSLIDVNNNGYISYNEIHEKWGETIKLPKIPQINNIIVKSYKKAQAIMKPEVTENDNYLTKD